LDRVVARELSLGAQVVGEGWVVTVVVVGLEVNVSGMLSWT
jgi:hypothetical protein